MRHATIILLAAVMALGISSAVRAETIFSQNFDGDAFVLGTTLTSTETGIGNSATTDGLWRLGPLYGSNGVGPKVVNDYAHSGSKSMYLTRVSGQSKKLEGYTAMPDFAPLNEGVFEASVWLRRGNNGGTTFSLTNHTVYSTGSTVNCSALYANSAVLKYSDQAGAWVEVSDVTLPENAWFGLKMVVDLDNDLYDVWYNSGAGWTEVASNLGLRSGYTDRNVNCLIIHPSAPNDGQIWVDDCMLQTIPEPSTLALLGAGLIGLLCYAWRKGK